MPISSPRCAACCVARNSHERRGNTIMACILIVDDNATNLKLAVRLLEHAGHAVLGANDGPAGLQLARDRLPDLVLMDIQMPGMDGVAALRELRADPAIARIRVVALTALAMTGDRESLLAAGFDAYLAKPIRHQEFLAMIEQMLNGPPPGPVSGAIGMDE
jgi:two-component system cell cycle response regulator DivK